MMRNRAAFSLWVQSPEIENYSKEGVEKTGQLFDMDLWSSIVALPPTPWADAVLSSYYVRNQLFWGKSRLEYTSDRAFKVRISDLDPG